MNIIVLAGGLSTERNVSLSSGSKICRTLCDLGHRAALVDLFLGLEDYDRPLEDIFQNPPALPQGGISGVEPDLEKVRASRRDRSRSIFGPGVLEVCRAADVVFLGLHGACGEDGRVQAAFDLMGIPYTGSGYLGSAIAMDKNLTKELVAPAGVNTPPWEYVTVTAQNIPVLMERHPAPCVVKVPQGGSSIGVSICQNQPQLRTALESAVGEPRVIETFIAGREFSCGVLDGTPLPPIEIIPKEGFYDYKNKYQPGATVEVCPAEIPPEKAAQMQDRALLVHRLLGLSAYSRCDFLMDAQGEIYFLEVNTLPGMTPTSLIPQEAAAVGMDYPTLCQTIIDIAMRERG